MFKEGKNYITTGKKHKRGLQCDRLEKNENEQGKAKMLLWFRFKFKEGKNCITTAKKQKKRLRCDRAEKSVNYQRKVKILLWFRLRLTERD